MVTDSVNVLKEAIIYMCSQIQNKKVKPRVSCHAAYKRILSYIDTDFTWK